MLVLPDTICFLGLGHSFTGENSAGVVGVDLTPLSEGCLVFQHSRELNSSS